MSRKRKSTKNRTESRKIARIGGIIRPLDPDDPRNPDHPSHEEQWSELRRALGRAVADFDFDLAQKKGEI
jgi:hypothetical protein